jgi:hypothetical protein
VIRALALLGVAAGVAQAQDTIQGFSFTWRDRVWSTAAPPAELAAPALEQVLVWGPWARSSGYRMDLSVDERLLVLSSARARRHEDDLRLGQDVLALFDRELPAPKRDPALEPPLSAPSNSAPAPAPQPPEPRPSDGEKKEGGEGPPPEDPDAPPARRVRPNPTPAPKDAPAPVTEPAASVAGSLAWLERETIVVLDIEERAQFQSVLAFIAVAHPRLAGWSSAAAGDVGFALGAPLCTGFLEEVGEREEWDRDHELVNRVAHAALLRRFGPLPNWLEQGLAWRAELELLRAVYCFPYRTGFVGAGEHGDWNRQLESLFRDRVRALTVGEFADWTHGTYVDEKAKIAWGVVDFFARQRPGSLSALCEGMRHVRERDGRRLRPDGGWEYDLAFSVPLAEQTRLLRDQGGKTVFKDVSAWFANGCQPDARSRAGPADPPDHGERAEEQRDSNDSSGSRRTIDH